MLKIVLLVFVLLPLAFADDVEVSVDIPGVHGGGKFRASNITRDENKVVQAAFDGMLDDLIASRSGVFLIVGTGSNNRSFVARLSRDARTLEQRFELPPEFLDAVCIAEGPDGSVAVGGRDQNEGIRVGLISPNLEKLQWSRTVTGDRPASVAVAPDGSVVVCPEQKPFVSRIAADGSRLIPFGNNDTFRTDGANPDIHKAWWEDCGFAKAGHSSPRYHAGGCAGVVALPDGEFVLFTTNFLKHPGGLPDFDPMLLRFNSEGKIIWCTNLLDGLPAESDHKQPHMVLDPSTGDLLLTAIQHGHFKHNLIASPGAFLTPHEWLTGDIMIGWIARVDASTGRPKAATFYFPELSGQIVGGKKRANSLFPAKPALDAEGNFYVTGKSAWKLPTTLHAFQTEPLGGSGFLSVFNPNLTRLLHSSLITAKGASMAGKAVAIAPGGPVVLGSYEIEKPAEVDFESTNADATNFLLEKPAGPKGGFFGIYPSGNWFE
jgi:hypothetical protein